MPWGLQDTVAMKPDQCLNKVGAKEGTLQLSIQATFQPIWGQIGATITCGLRPLDRRTL